MQRLFPIVIVLLSAAAALVYAYKGEWPQAMYWASAMSIGISVLLM